MDSTQADEAWMMTLSQYLIDHQPAFGKFQKWVSISPTHAIIMKLNISFIIIAMLKVTAQC
jgi:hypothetical protein